MALFAIGLNLAKCTSGKPLLAISNITPIFSSTIVSKVFKEEKPKPAPFPYREKNYPVWRSWIDRTTQRFDENSKLIVVDGPLAAGKTEFAKKLAEELDMFHISDANMDIRYINPYGYDMRKLDSQLPENVRSFDEKNFCQDPFHFNVAAFQFWMYRLRYSLYIDALAHILSTGQGVVLQRSPWSDTVFVEAMFKNKYIGKEARNIYHEVKRSTIHQLMKPHLIIYLDMPVNVVQENINKRCRPYEINSKALTATYLQDIEDFYKIHYLPEITIHAELLMYDWSEGGDVEVVVEDIERIDFDKYSKHDNKMKDWRKEKESNWAESRMLYADKKEKLMSLFNVPLTSAPELLISGGEMDVWNKVWYSAPGMEYEEGFDVQKGDKNLLFKTKTEKYVRY